MALRCIRGTSQSIHLDPVNPLATIIGDQWADSFLSTIWSENRFPLFRIVLSAFWNAHDLP